MLNRDVKVAMFEANIRQWQLAKIMGCSEAQMSRLLNRSELPREKQEEMIARIREGYNA